MTCAQCKSAVPADATNCPACGTEVAPPVAELPTLQRQAAAVRPTPPPKQDKYIGCVIGGKFRIDELLGTGGMGKVFRARHLALDKTICLKMLRAGLSEDPTLVARFEREAKAASRLSHPNSIAVLDFGQDEEGTLFIVMEYVQGKDLRQILLTQFPIEEERLCRLLAQALDALSEAHAMGVIHRDLKPENIMVEPRPTQRVKEHVKVLDFGIAKIEEGSQLTRPDVVCGTPQYMSPEQATGSVLDSRSDLYGMGVILYQLTTGSLPFEGANSMEVLTKHVRDLPVPPRQKRTDVKISVEMEALTLRALAKRPEDRPQTAGEFRDAILAIADHAAQAKAAGKTWPLEEIEEPAVDVVLDEVDATDGRSEPGGRGPVAEDNPAPKKRTPLVIGGAIAAAALVVGGFFVFGKTDKPAAVASEVPKAAPVNAPMAATVPAIAPAIPTASTSATKAATATPNPTPSSAKVAMVAPTKTSDVSEAKAPARVAAAPLDPEKAARLMEQALPLLKNGEQDAALVLLQAAVASAPGNAKAHRLLGQCYGLRQESDKEHAEYEQVVKLAPTSMDATLVRPLLE